MGNGISNYVHTYTLYIVTSAITQHTMLLIQYVLVYSGHDTPFSKRHQYVYINLN